MKKNSVNKRAFSLAEVLAALVISSMIILAVFSLYNRLNRVSAAVINKIDRGQLPREILQLIAEDLDRIVSDSRDTRINFQNKIEGNGLQSGRIEIIKTIYDKDNNPITFEQIIWQTSVDFAIADKGMVLYRRHSGIAMEDKLLDEPKQGFEKQLFIPVCGGVTFFSIQTGLFQTGDIQSAEDGKASLIDRWSGNLLPANIIATISFADPIEITPGQWQVPDTEKITRTIALDRTRKIPFKIEMIVSKDTNESNNLSDNKNQNITDANR